MSKAEQILAARGGVVSEAALTATGAFGVVRSAAVVRVVVGTEADTLAPDTENPR